MLGKTHVYETLVRESHLDTFGHVNNAKYLEILEEARWDLITRNGYGMDTILVESKGPVVLEVSLKFKRELRLRDKIRIESTTVDYRGRIAHLRQQIFNQEGELCADALFTCGLFDTLRRRLIRPTEKWLRALGVDSVECQESRHPVKKIDSDLGA